MKTIVPFLSLLLFFTFSIGTNCRKKHDNPCEGLAKPTGRFLIKEMIGDTAFIADTIFRDNYVQFQAIDDYGSVTWKLGSDPRDWTSPDFFLSLHTALGEVPIQFSGRKAPNPQCFPGDSGIYSSTRNLTMVEQVTKPYNTISPLVGTYTGYFINAPLDTFTVRLEYFDSTKYDASITGSKNFYWFSNMPKGFTSTTNAAAIYPELKNGFSPEMGYKCFVFNYDSYHQGKAWLSHDSLYINYGDNVVGRKQFIGRKN
jgi:hypothetical protein